MEGVLISAFVAGLPAFFAVSIAIELTPGPNMAYLAMLSLREGRIAGLWAVLGIALGLSAVGIAAALGGAVLVASNPLIYELLRWGGVAYLVWLAYDSWRESRQPIDADDRRVDELRSFRRGLITNLLNPKAALFYLTVTPNFITPNGPYLGQALSLTAVYVFAATLIHTALVMIAGTLSPLLTGDKVRKRAGVVFAALLLLVAIWLAVGTQR